MNRFGFGPRTVGLVLFCLALIPVAMQGGLVRLLAPRLGEVRLATIAILSYVLGFVIVGYSEPSAARRWWGLAFCGVGSGLFNPSASALALEAGDRAGSRRRHGHVSVWAQPRSCADSVRLRRPLCGGRAERAVPRRGVSDAACRVAHLEFATCRAHDCVLMKERSTLQPFSPGDVFVGSTVLDGVDDDSRRHAGRILQYDADSAEKGVRSGSAHTTASGRRAALRPRRAGCGRSTRRRSSCSRWSADGTVRPAGLRHTRPSPT